MTERFPYRELVAPPTFADPEPRIFRPVIPITIFGRTRSFPTTGMIDTGCVETILPLSLFTGGLVDPDFSANETGVIEALGGERITLLYGVVDLAIRLKHKTHRWRAIVGFTEARQDVILGDAGFLRYFTVTLNRAGRYTTLRPDRTLPAPNWPDRSR